MGAILTESGASRIFGLLEAKFIDLNNEYEITKKPKPLKFKALLTKEDVIDRALRSDDVITLECVFHEYDEKKPKYSTIVLKRIGKTHTKRYVAKYTKLMDVWEQIKSTLKDF